MCVTGGAIVVNLFFILKKEIGILQKISIIGVLSAVINVFIITVTMFIGFKVKNCVGEACEYHGITQLDWSKINLWGVGGWDMFSKQLQGLASIIFCYVNHQLVFPLVNDLKNPTKRRMDKVFFRVHLTEVIVYIAVGMTGYLLLV
jgi:amino acid permease